MKTLFMEKTKIPVGQTVAEIQRVLGESGCTAVMTEYDKGEIRSVCFKINFMDREVPFKLPCRWEPIFNILYKRKKKGTHSEGPLNTMKEQAKRIAWRQILRWVEAQLALVDTDMVKVQEVFLQYAQCGPKGETLYERIEQKGFIGIEYKGTD